MAYNPLIYGIYLLQYIIIPILQIPPSICKFKMESLSLAVCILIFDNLVSICNMLFEGKGRARIVFLKTESNSICHEIAFLILINEDFNSTFSFLNYANSFKKQFAFKVKSFTLSHQLK